MANNVTSIITIKGDKEQTEKLVSFIKGDDNCFDLDKIAHMPEGLDIECSSEGDYGLRYFYVKSKEGFMLDNDELKFIGMMNEMRFENKERFDNIVNLGLRYVKNIIEYGYKTWYDFRCSVWGTKWNTYDTESGVDADGNRYFEFNTAWTFPYNAIRTLSEKFPELRIEFVYADWDDTSSNTGKGAFVNGQEVDCVYPADGSKEAFDLYFETHPEEKDCYRLDEEIGNYVYVDDEDEDEEVENENETETESEE